MVSDSENMKYSSYPASRLKRVFDVAASLMFLVPGMVITAFAAFLVFLFEGRPVFFVHYRVGRDGRLFRMPKLRTMQRDAPPYRCCRMPEKESLVTRTGKFLRRHRIDEMPQLLCVLAGDMSLVGPRPELPNVVMTYRPCERRRLLVRPGLTGLWQLMGNRSVAIHKDIFYDLYYLEYASVWLDIRILASTLVFIFRPE